MRTGSLTKKISALRIQRKPNPGSAAAERQIRTRTRTEYLIVRMSAQASPTRTRLEIPAMQMKTMTDTMMAEINVPMTPRNIHRDTAVVGSPRKILIRTAIQTVWMDALRIQS